MGVKRTRSSLPLPSGRYRVVLADPPWSYQNWTDKKNGAAAAHYPTLSVQEIRSIPVADLAHPKGCALFLWATFPKVREALSVIEAWGFRYVTCAFVWRKVNPDGSPYMGLGFYTRSAYEICLLGLKGRMTPARRDIRQEITAPVRRHSEKPQTIYDKIEALFPHGTPRLELFCRGEPHLGWRGWGDEAEDDSTHTRAA